MRLWGLLMASRELIIDIYYESSYDILIKL
jgi:hypothetical protein